ncbi:homing endonuclease associated repeat-containing protein [Candidatus Nitrospira bockiana]
MRAGASMLALARLTDEDVLADLRRVAERVGGPLRISDYRPHGRVSPEFLIRRFGSWSNAKRLAGLMKENHSAFAEDAEFKRAQAARRKRRVCLKCDETFFSAGPHNRICERCQLSPEWRRGDQTGGAIGSRRRWREACQ